MTQAQPLAAAPRPGTVERQLLVLSMLAVVVGLVTGAAATLFIAVIHNVEHYLFHTLPGQLGHEHAPPWLVTAILVTGAVLTWAAKKLPGGGGHSPLMGFGLDITQREIVSVMLAALASLPFGAVLGPEAPLTALGTALGALAFKEGNPARQVMMIAGAMGAVAAIFGNPIVVSVLLLEIALIAGGRMSSPLVLVPALVGTAASYVLQVGFADWSGLGEVSIALPDLPAYPGVRLLDLVVAIPVALLTAMATMGARLLATKADELGRRQPLATIVGAALLTAATAVIVSEMTGTGIDLVLFSGQAAMPGYLMLTSVGTVVAVLIGKLIGYGLCMGGGFRGGPIFPAIALGFLVAVGASLLVGGAGIAGVAAAGLAAGTASATKAPFMATLLAVMLTIGAGGAVTVLAILGTLVGLLMRMSAEHLFPALTTPGR